MERRKFLQNVAAGVSMSVIGVKSFAETTNNQAYTSLIKPEGKSVWQKSAQSEGVYYNSILNAENGKNDLAFLWQKGNFENLMYQKDLNSHPIAITKKEFILSPFLFDKKLVWVERESGKWRMGLADLNNFQKPSVNYFSGTKGRPINPQIFAGKQSHLLVWEERIGLKTTCKVARINDSNDIEILYNTQNDFNSYDSVGITDNDGVIHLVFTGFFKGQYRIFHQESENGMEFSKPTLLNNSANACLYPSLCKNKDGGIWISYTDFMLPAEFADWDIPFSQHKRRNAQHNFFRSKAFTRIIHYHNGTIKAPFAPATKSDRDGFIASGIVFGSDFSKRSQVFEDNNGRIGVIIRKHQDYEETVFPEDGQLKNDGQKVMNRGMNSRSDLAVIFYDDFSWTEPITLIRRAHFESPISCKVMDNSIVIAFTEDGRQTGWGKSGERFDNDNEIGVGICNLKINYSKNTEYDFHPLTINPVPVEGMEEPTIVEKSKGFLTVFGQTHLHTENSVCTRAYDQNYHNNYRFIQDVQKCRFAGITDHDYNMGPCEQHYMKKLAEYYYFPNEFVALQSYEWTCPDGHINPLSFEEKQNLEVFSPYSENGPGNTYNSLWEQYKDMKVIAPPHHMVDMALPFEWENFNGEFMPVVELFQDRRGSGEQPGVAGVTNYSKQGKGYWAMNELLKKRRFGLIAGGDHSGLALAGVLVKKITRSEIYNALKKMKCFGTTGNQIQIRFYTSNAEMGGSTSKKNGNYNLKISSPEKIDRIEIVTNGDTVEKIHVNENTLETNWKIMQGITFCRIILENGDVGWTSPIWIT